MSWDKLSMAEKADIMKLAVESGIYDLDTIRKEYNTFAGGGSTKDDDLVDWIIKEEGFNTKPEDIGDGKMTLGSGLTAQKWHDLYKKRGNKWSAQDNRRAVAEEVANRRRWAEKTIPNWDSLPESSQKALLSYKYNYDFTPANSPKLFKALKDSNLREAARQMDATSKDPKFKKGLKDRRQREQAWFLSEVPMGQPDFTPSYAAPAVSTQVVNPYIMQAQNEPISTKMIPNEDSYVEAHRLTPSEERLQRLQDRWEAINDYNRVMRAVGIKDNPIEKFVSTSSLLNPTILDPTYANGGSIHIKPSHRGRLTELKKRTGKSEAELYNDGNPAHKKMVVFARNARKWKHDDGGNLYGGNNKNGQQMQLGLKVTNGWQPYSLEQVLDFAAINEANKAVQEAVIARRANDYLTASNDATAIADGRLQNQHLTKRAIEGAKAHRAWEEEHPVMNTIGNVLGVTPLAVAAIPVVGAAVESAPAVASALAPGSAFWVNPVTQQVAASTLGGEAVNLATKVATPYDSWGEGVSDVVNQTIGWNPQETWWGSTLADMTNPGYWTPYGAVESGTAKAIEGVSPINRAVKNTVDNIERRGIETFMRTTPFANPIPEAKNGFLSMWNGQQGGRQRLAHIADYVLTGRKVGPKGYYNSFADFQPTNLAEMVKEPTFAERWEAFKNPTGISHGYSGFVDVNGMVPVMQERPDMIDAFLYGKTIDPSFGVRRLSIGDNFGPHTQYVAEKYASKAHDIPVYEVATPDGIDVATPVGDWKGVDKGLFDTGTGDFLNVAGHIGTKGTTADGTSVIQRQDIWKFNPDEYFNRWLQNTRPYEEMSSRLKKAAQWGLKEVDRLGTPVITRTKWDKWGWL